MQATRPFTVLFLGCGNIAGGFDAERPPHAPPLSHAGAYTSHSGFQLAACVDPDEDRRQRFAQRWSVPISYADIATPIAQGQRFDVISICSPTALHGEHLEAALRLRPRAIFCEKPVTKKLEQTEHWVAACEGAGVLLAVNHTRRWDPEVVELFAALRQGTWGKLRSIVGHYNKGILNNGGHLLDLLLYLAGPLELLATAASVHDFWPDDPTVAALLRTSDGVPVYLSPGDARDYAFFELEVVCENGVLRMEDGGMGWRTRRAIDSPHFRGYRGLDAGKPSAGGYPAAMSAAVANLFAALSDGAPLASSGHSALLAQRLCASIHAAALPGARDINPRTESGSWAQNS